MATSPVKIRMFSLTESGSESDLPSSQNEENPSPSPNQEAKKSSHNPNPNPCTNLHKENPLQNPATFGHGHGAEKEKEKKKATGKEKAANRKLPPWARASNQDETARPRRETQTQTQTKKMGMNLQEVIEAFSGDFDEKKLREMDILEVAAMKGIVLDNPPWWPPQGYPDILSFSD